MTADADLIFFAERGSGPPLLLIHGLMVTGEMFAPVIEPLARQHRLIIPDLRGHGRSRSLPPPYTVVQLARDLVRLLDHLGIDQVDVLGYSQGGAVAQQFALDHPTRCRRLVLGCTFAFNTATWREKMEGWIAPPLIRLLGMRGLARFVIAQGMRHIDAASAALVTRLIAGQDRDLMIAAWRAAMAFDSRQRLAEIRCPTLVIAAANDTALPFHHARMLHEGIAGSELSVIDNAGHALIWERPEAFLQAVEDFLAR